MTSAVRLVIAHTMPGRTRLRLADSRANVFHLAVAATRLKSLAAVQSVDPRPLTGGLLVHHAGSFSAIRDELPGLGLVLVQGETDEHRPSGPTVDPSVTAAALVALALFQLRSGRLLPPALTLLWYAGSMLGYSQKHTPPDR